MDHIDPNPTVCGRVFVNLLGGTAMVSFWWIQSAIVTRDCASILLALQGFYFATSRAGNWAISLWQACVKRVKLTYSLTPPPQKIKTRSQSTLSLVGLPNSPFFAILGYINVWWCMHTHTHFWRIGRSPLVLFPMSKPFEYLGIKQNTRWFHHCCSCCRLTSYLTIEPKQGLTTPEQCEKPIGTCPSWQVNENS